MKRALVTGGGGFIGAAIARALAAAGHAVQVAGNTTDDLLTPDRVTALGTDFDLIVHCAGGSSVGASVAEPLVDFTRTVPPLAALLDHVRTRARGARVVVLSSAAVYGNASQVPTPETAPIAPVSPYGVHKRMCEELCASYGTSYGVATTVLRLFSVYGPPLRRQLLWDACQKVSAGDVVFGGTGDEQRDWLHVEDAAALVLAAAAAASPQTAVFNGGSGVGVSVRDVVARICRELGAEEPRFSGAARAGDPSRYVADIAKARALGWAPSIDIDRGISEYVAWFREHG